MSLKDKLVKARDETADALDAFKELADPPSPLQVADIRRKLCAVTGKLLSVESELALQAEKERK